MRGLGFLVWGGGDDGSGLGIDGTVWRVAACRKVELAWKVGVWQGGRRAGQAPPPTVIPRDSTGPFRCVCGFAGVAALGRLA